MATKHTWQRAFWIAQSINDRCHSLDSVSLAAVGSSVVITVHDSSPIELTRIFQSLRARSAQAIITGETTLTVTVYETSAPMPNCTGFLIPPVDSADAMN